MVGVKSISEDYLNLYANSFARLQFFKAHFTTDHPTYMAEISLFELNESRLRSSLYINIKINEIDQCRSMIEHEIKKRVHVKLKSIIEDEKMLSILKNIKSADFDELFRLTQ